MKYTEIGMLDALSKSFSMYKIYGARSTRKLLSIHTYVADVLRSIWGDQFDVYSMESGGKELKVAGKYYQKDIDITVTDKNKKPIFCVGIKFVTSNYKQNANNYFENMMGETANIQANNNLPYAHIIFLRHETPYYKKNDPDEATKIEVINVHDLSKYIHLMFDSKQAHRPIALGLMLVDVDEETQTVSKTDIEGCFEEEVVEILNKKLSLDTFFDEIETYKNYVNSKI